MQPHTPLETLGLVGAVRARITDADRAWMNTALASEEGSFECMDGGERGLLLAWRRPGTSPESASLGKSISGTQHVLVVGRVEYPSRSADDLANVLEREGESAWSSLSGPCVVMTWSNRDREHRFVRPASGQRVLFYARVSDGLLFASDASTLVEHPEVDARTDWRSAADHMALGHIYGEKTLFRGVQRLG